MAVVFRARQAVLRCLYAYFLVRHNTTSRQDAITLSTYPLALSLIRGLLLTPDCEVSLVTWNCCELIVSVGMLPVSGPAGGGGAVPRHPIAHRHQAHAQSLRVHGKEVQDVG